MSRNPFQVSGLDRLATEYGVDVRSTVLRVATDLFCQARTRTPAEITRFCDLALPLIDCADVRTREIVAGKLARVTDTPAAVSNRLRADPDAAVRAAAGGQIRSVERPARHPEIESVTDALARIHRGGLDQSAAMRMAGHPSSMVAVALVDNPQIALRAEILALLADRARDDQMIAQALLRRVDIPPAILAPLYLHAPAEIRARIRIAVERAGVARAVPVAASALAVLNEAARSGNRLEIADAMGDALGVDRARMRQIFDDPRGDTLALALGAVGLKRAAAITVLLVAAAPEVRQSVELVFASASIHETTPRHIARRIVEAVAGSRTRTAPRHEPHLDPSGARERDIRGERRNIVRLAARRTSDRGA